MDSYAISAVLYYNMQNSSTFALFRLFITKYTSNSVVFLWTLGLEHVFLARIVLIALLGLDTKKWAKDLSKISLVASSSDN